MLFDCQLDHHPLIRIEAADAAAAKAEYFRLYAIVRSTAAWHCHEAAAGTPAPVEPERWVERRKELGTWAEPTTSETPKPSQAPDKPKESEAAP